MRRWWFSIHKWVGLVVGLQILAWMVSGLFMTLVPIEQVRSEHNIRKTESLDLRAQSNVVAPAAVAALLTGRITRLELGEMLGAPVWRADIDGKPAALIDARSGAVLSPLNESNARRIAEADFAGEGSIARAMLIEKDPPIEYRGALPVWQLVFDDEADTHLYVSPATGKVAARRSGVWRVYDFLWSLHIMDYQTRDNFNNWLVIIASAVGLVLTVTGFGILVYRFWPKSTSS
jgi:uncharacterized iron-regulated membrane protein